MRATRLGWTSLVCCGVLAGSACGGGGGAQDACLGVTCSGHGACTQADGVAACTCDTGYVPSEDGLDCVLWNQTPCTGVTCSGHGRCRLTPEDQPYCECEPGYYPSQAGLDCLANACTGDCGPNGCCGDHCCALVPTNATTLGGFQATGLTRSATGDFDTAASCVAGAALGDCQVVAQAGGPGVCVCRLDLLTVQGTLRVRGPNALAVLAHQSIQVDGVIDLAGRGAEAGPGAEAAGAEANSWYGGRGGSFGSRGGSSGAEVRGNPRMAPLLGGQAGQAGCGGKAGGGGGGALQLSARDLVEVSGEIRAGGGGGAGGGPDDQGTCLGGAGGGSGGGILLEADQVTISGLLAADGGGAGGGGNNQGAAGGDGADAAFGQAAPGGAGRDGAGCALVGSIEGGDGGAGSLGGQPGGDGQSYDTNDCDFHPYVGGGGGGGGAGRITAKSMQPCSCSGSASPAVEQLAPDRG